MKIDRWLAASIIALGATTVQAQRPEHERLSSERAAANARLTEQERACEEKFVVSACLESARKEHRATLARLRRAELVLDDGERREAAARRRQSILEKASAQAARASDAASVSPRQSPRATPVPNPPAPAHAGGPDRSTVLSADQQATEERNRANFEARARAAQAHRESVERRNAQREANGNAAAPLPVPPGASAP